MITDDKIKRLRELSADEKWYTKDQDFIRNALPDLLDEIERLRKEKAERQEAEASVCPEDVGMVEYVKSLERKLNEANRKLKILSAHPEYEVRLKTIKEAYAAYDDLKETAQKQLSAKDKELSEAERKLALLRKVAMIGEEYFKPDLKFKINDWKAAVEMAREGSALEEL